MTDEDIKRQIDENVTAACANLTLKSIACALWGTDADKEWNADTLNVIADTLRGVGIGPNELHDENEPPEFRALDDVTRCDLTEWFNRREPDAEEFALLAKLANDGRFKAWDCPSCMDRVYEGKPESWDDFQGVRQNDRVSYPGNGPNDKRCDSCRCHNR